jgi:hypothetical protein
VIALARFEFRGYLLSHRWVAPLLTYLGLLGVVYALPAGPAVPVFAVTAFGLVPVGAFTTRGLLGAEDAVSRQVTAAAGRGPVRVQGALLLAAAGGIALLSVVAVAWGTVANHAGIHSWRAVLGGLGLHAVFGLVGLALGAVFARPLVDDAGPAVLGIVGASVLALVMRVSPLAWALRVLVRDPHHGFAAMLTPPVLTLLGLGLLGAGASLLAARRAT